MVCIQTVCLSSLSLFSLAAKKDLDEAIRLADDETNLDRLVARQAYCQRGLIFMLEENQQQGWDLLLKKFKTLNESLNI